MRYDHVARAVFSRPLAVLPETLDTIAALVAMRMRGERLTAEEIRENLAIAAASAGPRGGRQREGAVGVIPIYGILAQRSSMMSDMSGGTSVAQVTQAFRVALADPNITSILLEFDSPGGEVGGIEELAAEIRAARGQKPIVALANTLMASAAYWLGCAADEVVAAPSAMVGSIGVYATHVDQSEADRLDGVKPTFISAGKYKTEGNAHEPLTDEARGALQQLVDDYYGAFVGSVAKGRGVSAAAVRGGYGEGRVLAARRAMEAGLVDRVATFDDTIRRMASGRVTSRATAALTGFEGPTATAVDDVEADEIAALYAADDHREPDRTTEAAAALAIAKAHAAVR